MLAVSYVLVPLRSLAIPLGFALAMLYVMVSTLLFRADMYMRVDLDEEDGYITSGTAKGMFMLLGFVVLIGASMGITIADAEQGCPSWPINAMDVCQDPS